MNPEVARFLKLLAPDGNLDWLLFQQLKSKKTIPATPETATHYCIASMPNRQLANYVPGAHRAICVDDVGTKRNAPAVVPSFMIETSPDNFQYVYLIDDPAAELEDVKALLHALNHDLQLGDPQAYGANALFRLPGGQLPPGKTHAAHLMPIEADVLVWTISELYEDFACERTIAEHREEMRVRKAALRADEPGDMMPEAAALLELISPDLPRDPSSGWMRVIMALHYESEDDPKAGLELAHAWSSRATVKKYDPKDLDYQWANLDSREVAVPVRIGSLRQLAREVDEARARAIIDEHARLRRGPTDAGIAAMQDAAGVEGEPTQGRRPSDVIMPELLERLVLTPNGVVDLYAEPLTAIKIETMALLFNAHDDPPVPPAYTPISAVKVRWARHPGKHYSIKPPQRLPREPFGFLAERQEDSYVAGAINAYRPRQLRSDGPQPGDSGRVEAFLRHMAWAYPGEGDTAYALDWFAYKLQHPWQRMTALCSVTPEPGTGRTSAAALLGLVLGRGNSMVMRIKSILDDPFNTYLKLPLLIVNEAANTPSETGSSTFKAGRSMIDKLNDIVDPGGGEVSIREMRTDPYSTLSPTAFIINTNRQAALQLDDRDRRFDISRGNERRMPDKLAKWMQRVIEAGVEDEAALDAVQRYLLARDVTEFRYWDVRRSEAKAVMASEARTGLEVAVDSALEALGQPVLITTALLADVMKSTAMRKADREAHGLVKDMTVRELTYALRAWAHDHTHVPGCMGGVADIQVEGEKHRPRERNGRSRYRELKQRDEMVEALKQLRDKIRESVRTEIIHPFVVHKGGRGEQAPDDHRDD